MKKEKSIEKIESPFMQLSKDASSKQGSASQLNSDQESSEAQNRFQSALSKIRAIRQNTITSGQQEGNSGSGSQTSTNRQQKNLTNEKASNQWNEKPMKTMDPTSIKQNLKMQRKSFLAMQNQRVEILEKLQFTETEESKEGGHRASVRLGQEQLTTPTNLAGPDYETDQSESKDSFKTDESKESKVTEDKQDSQTKNEARKRPQLPTLNVTTLGSATLQKPSLQNLKNFTSQDQDIIIQQHPSRNAPLRYSSAIYLYFQGDMKINFHIHSLAPVKDRVEISNRPQLTRKNLTNGDQTTRWQLDTFNDWECAPALKIQGDIFRVLPAVDHSHLEKIRKILKTKKELEPKNFFKYGEYLESINEEIKFNLDVVQEFKNQYVTFGSSIMLMHINSQQFLKISSPNMSDHQLQFKLKLTPYISEKTIFKLLPSNKLQQEGDGKIHENEQFFLAYTYDKILNKNLYLYTEPDLLEKRMNKKRTLTSRYEIEHQEMIFAEDKKLPLHFGISPFQDYEHSENIFKHLNGKVVQIKHIESELFLTLTIKRKENRILNLFFGDKNRYSLNTMIDHVPSIYGKGDNVNVHFEPRDSINTFWRLYASPHHRDLIYLENAVSKIRLKPFHLLLISKPSQISEDTMDQLFYKLFIEQEVKDNNYLIPKRTSILEQTQTQMERKYLWVEYLKFNKVENKYEFSKFGKMNEEDMGNLFDSFKILPVDTYKVHAFEFISNAYKSLKTFDCYQADNEESTEYEQLLKVLKQLKKFLLNKLSNFINVDDEYGQPNENNQVLFRETFILEELVDLLDNIWPDENYMRKDFGEIEEKSDISAVSQVEDIHKEIKMSIAEKIFELLKLSCIDNLQNQEFVFFDVIPQIQKFFGVGFRKNQDFELINYLVQNCDKYADYKEKTKYNIIFQFIKKLFKEKSNDVKANIFHILRSFCVNSKGIPNHYHQKLLHDLFFFNKLEGIRFTLREQKTFMSKSTSQKVQEPQMDVQIQRIQEELKDIEDCKNQNKDNQRLMKSNSIFEDQEETSDTKEIKLDFQQVTERTQHQVPSFQEQPILVKDQSESLTDRNKDKDRSHQNTFRDLTASLEDEDDYTKVQTQIVDDEFIIKHIHDITFDNLLEEFLLQRVENPYLTRLQLYFFADLCYLMNFDCPCSRFTHKTVSNLMNLIINPNSKLDIQVKAGLARILNTILRNFNDNIIDRPYYLRMYEEQEFVYPPEQSIISSDDVRKVVKLTRDHFKVLTGSTEESLSEYDSEIIRLSQFVIQSNLIFIKDFKEGMNFVTDIFEDIARIHLNKVKWEKQQKVGANLSHSSYFQNREGGSSLNLEEFQKQFKRMKKLLQMNLENMGGGNSENPIAWKMLNLEKQYSSFVENIVVHDMELNSLVLKSNFNSQQQDNSKLEMVRFFQWILNLRLDHLISNIINMFYKNLESLLQKGEVNLDNLVSNGLSIQFLSTDFITQVSKPESKYQFFEYVINYAQNHSEKQEFVQDIEEMYREFLSNYAKYESNVKPRQGFSSPLKKDDPRLQTEQDEVVERLVQSNITRSQTFRKSSSMARGKSSLLVENEDIQEDVKEENKEENQQEQDKQKEENQIQQQQNNRPGVLKYLFNIAIAPFRRNGGQQPDQSEDKEKKAKQMQSQFIDLLVDVFVSTQDPLLQEECMKVLFKYMNIRRELLKSLHKSIVLFRSNLKPKVETLKQTLKKSKLIINDSTIWEMPNDSEKAQDQRSQLDTVIEDFDENMDESPNIRLVKSKSTKITKKQQYAQKVKEYQKSTHQLIQTLAFTKSNKTTVAKLQQLDQFLGYLNEISEFFQPFTGSASRVINPKVAVLGQNVNPFSTNEIANHEVKLKQLATESLNHELQYIQQDLQYSFLAINGQEILLSFMKLYKDLRQESVRTLFYNQKNLSQMKDSEIDPKVVYAIKILVIYKKCFEILIKFIYNNKTTKQILLNYVEEILLFNSEYYMQSKMTEEINLYDFDLLNHIIENNSNIKHISTILTPRISNLVQYIQKIIEFPKKPMSFAPRILKVYSNIIAYCDSTKINDEVVDIILKEEPFFQIQGLLLGIKARSHFKNVLEHYYITEKFLKGISAILKAHNIRMIKKKFYQIFNKRDDLESYFRYLKELLAKNVDKIKEKLNDKDQKDQADSLKTQGSEKEGVRRSSIMPQQSASLLSQIEQEITDLGKRFLLIESYYIHIFYQLFFEIKGTQKQLLDKVEEMKIFLDNREKDLEVLEPYVSIFDVEEWEQYTEFIEQIEVCRKFCIKYAAKSNINRDISKISQFSQTSLLMKGQAELNKSRSMKKIQDSISEKTDAGSDSTKKLTSLKNKLLGDDLKGKAGGSKQPLLKKRMTQMLSAISQNQIAQKKEKIFQTFKWNIIHDEKLKHELKKEMNVFAEVLLKKFKIADQNVQDYEAQKYYLFFTKLVEYANKFDVAKERLQDTKMLVEVFSNFIDLTNEGQSYKGEGFEAKTQIQEKLNQIGAVSMALEMMCSEKNEVIDEIFPQLLFFANRILDGADDDIQQVFTDYLTKNPTAINLFERCYILIEKDIQFLQKKNQENLEQQSINATIKEHGINVKTLRGQQSNQSKVEELKKSQKEKQTKAYVKEINTQKQILKFLKNLCENHNTKLQLLIGNQNNSDKNFDMVSLTANYLHALISNIHYSKRNYSNAMHCLIALAEYVQGPCAGNQVLIKEANFYQIAVQILQLKPHLVQDVNRRPDTEEEKISKQQQQARKISKKLSSAGFNLFAADNVQQKGQSDSGFVLSNFMIQKLKLNCTIILLSLLEQRSSDDPLLLSMKRSIPLDIIKQNIIYEYFLFCKDYNKFLTRENFFRHVLTQSDYEVTEELIIEVGFNLYFLLKRWSQNKKSNDSQLDELMSMIDQNQGFQNKYAGMIGTLRSILDFVRNIKANIKHLYKKVTKKGRRMDERHKQSRLEKFVSQTSNLQKALAFFKNNSGSIDVLIKNNVEQFCFPYMPYCTFISEEEKRDFYNALPTDRDKEKIEVLVNNSTDLIRRMKIEYEFKKFFINSPLIGQFVYYTELWKTFAFYSIIILNYMNLYSFTAANNNDRMYNPVFYGLTAEATADLYSFFGIFQIFFAICITSTIISKKAIYHYKLIFNDEEEEKDEEPKSQANDNTNEENTNHKGSSEEDEKSSRSKLLAKGFDYMLSALSDFQLVYYLGYLIFSFCGYIIHPFFYAYHMIDMIIRNPYLKNVLKAIYRPRYELLNTFVLFLCLQYVFALIAYIYIYSDFNSGECSSLSQCFLIIIDQTFKNDGGVGNFLKRAYPEEMEKGDTISIVRFFFDNVFNVVLVILVVEIISGIIMDTFGALREEHNKITDSIENKCMICGKNRDQIEKEFQDLQAQEESTSTSKSQEEKAFEIHKRERHNIFDYIFFLAYLQEKPELEYTGLESFVSEKYEGHNNTWFPIYKVGGDKQSHGGFVQNQEESGDEDDDDSQDDGNEHGIETDEQKAGGMSQKEIVRYLLEMNNKIDGMAEKLAFLDEEENETDDRGSVKGIRSMVKALKTGNSLGQNAMPFISQSSMRFTPNHDRVERGQEPPSPKLGVPSNNRLLAERRPSNPFSKTKVKIMALNAFRK